MSIFEFTVEWTGFSGAPGYSTFHTSNAGIYQTAIDNSATGIRQLLTDIAPALPTAVTVTLQQEVKELDAATGALIALASTTTVPTSQAGSGGASGPGPAGAVINWLTTGVNRGRVVRGRTFIVPCSVGAYQADGTLLDAVRTSLATSATTYRTSSAYESLVWSRPRSGAGGAAFPIVSSSVPDMAAVLRSRRD